MSTITAGNTVSTAITITGDTTGNLALTPFTGRRVILGGPLQYADGTTANTAAVGGPGTANVQSANFTAVSGFVYGVNTTAAAVTVTLPASPVAGNFITLVDYNRTFGTNNCIINPNGNKVANTTVNTVLNQTGTQATLFYIDSTQGWLQVSGSQSSFLGGYSANYLVISGGGGGGAAQSVSSWASGGGGGAGGYLESSITLTPSTVYTITVGAGGAGAQPNTNNGTNGSNSALGAINSVGGGAGGSYSVNGVAGGSGGGAGGAASGASGTSGQGNAGGLGLGSPNYGAGGGGGAGAVGGNGTTTAGGNGGAGTASSITGASVTRAGGGGGGTYAGGTAGSGGNGGGGSGGVGSGNNNGSSGTANTGGGGGGSGTNAGDKPSATSVGGSGGSGIVIISYAGAQRGTGGTVTSVGGNTIHTFTTSGTYTA